MGRMTMQVEIHDEFIRLGQLLKLSGLVDDGVEARELIVGGGVRLDGTVCTQRAKQVPVGSVVEVAGERVEVVAQP